MVVVVVVARVSVVVVVAQVGGAHMSPKTLFRSRISLWTSAPQEVSTRVPSGFMSGFNLVKAVLTQRGVHVVVERGSPRA